MALGTDTRDVLGHGLARSGLMVIPGLALGVAGALAGTRLNGGQLYGGAPNDPFAIARAVTSLALVALAAGAFTSPACRAPQPGPGAAGRIGRGLRPAE